MIIKCDECYHGACPECCGSNMEGGIHLVQRGRKCLTRKWLQTHTKGIIEAWQVEKCRKVIPGRGRTVSKGLRHSFPWCLQEQETAPDG